MNRYDYTALAKEKYRDIFLKYVSLDKLNKIIEDFKRTDPEERALVYQNLKNLFNDLYDHDYFRKTGVSPDKFYTKEVVLTLFISHRLEKLKICAEELDFTKEEYLSLGWFVNAYSRWKADSDAYERFRSELLQVFEMSGPSAAFSDYDPASNTKPAEELYNEFLEELSDEYKAYRKRTMGFTSKLTRTDAVEDYMFDAVKESDHEWDALFKSCEPFGDEFCEKLLNRAKKEKSYISTLAAVFEMKTPEEISSVLLKALADCFDGSDKKPADYIRRCLLTKDEKENEIDLNEDGIIERWIRALLKLAYEQKGEGGWYSSGQPRFKLADLEELVFGGNDPELISGETILDEYYDHVVGAEGCADYVKLFVDDFFNELFSRKDIDKASVIVFKKYQKMISEYLPGGTKCKNQDNRREFSRNEFRKITALLNELLNREYLLLEGNEQLKIINNLDSRDAVLRKEYILFCFNELLQKYGIDLTVNDNLSVELSQIYLFIENMKSEDYKNTGGVATRNKIELLAEKYPTENIVIELSEIMKSIRLKAGGRNEKEHRYMIYIYYILRQKPINKKIGESLREFLYDSAFAFSKIENGMEPANILNDIFCKAMQMPSVNFRSAEEIVYYNYLEEGKKLSEAKNTIKELKNRSRTNTASYKRNANGNYSLLIREAITSEYTTSGLIEAIKNNLNKPVDMGEDDQKKTLGSFYNYLNNNFCNAICICSDDELMKSIAEKYTSHRTEYKDECTGFSNQIVKKLKYNILPDITEHPHCLSKPFFFGTDTANDDYVTKYLLEDNITDKNQIISKRKTVYFYLQENLEDPMSLTMLIKDKELRNKIKNFRIRSCLREVSRESLIYLFAAYYFIKDKRGRSFDHFISCLNDILDLCRFEPLNNCLIFDSYIVCIAYMNIVANKQINFSQMISSLEEQYFSE